MASHTEVFLFFLLMTAFTIVNNVESHKRKIRTNRPIIGILTQTTYLTPIKYLGHTFIYASYVKFLESAGARVVPIFHNRTRNQTHNLCKSINGALLPGEVSNLTESLYALVARDIFDFAVETYDNGGYFPIMGIGLGHQMFATMFDIVNKDLRLPTNGPNITEPLNIPRHYRQTKMFSKLPKKLAKDSKKIILSGHFREYSLPVELFQNTANFSTFFRIVTSNVNMYGEEFISTMEAKVYPFYSMQWHPEKFQFEWNSDEYVPHSSAAIQLSQYISNFFVNEAKYSKHKFPSMEEENDALIYNYSPTFMLPLNESSSAVQIYFLN
ncbi:gamma-glutamyl hydrolase-like [Xenia sp. Carnegie-2017]|uniref:gamma-glutamyl hydrolase-like n=1 Tax=Xenia sp. Carnegie-2017 TaxID=2897299 RepID=UPI001F03DA52|nr:gamma-glutamyl hydrolase-like [Xenia sp. Carnegie-2017]